jgi:drug/metabolite transporter (DMT)-like permease
MADSSGRSVGLGPTVTSGIVLMLIANLLFAVVDASSKWLLALGLPALQLAFFRYAAHFAITIADASRHGFRRPDLTRHQIALLVFRALLLVTATIVNFIALRFLPLSVTGAIMFSSPIIVCLLSGPLLGERVGIWRWSAVLFGFAGVLVVIRPFSEGFQWAALMMLYPATCFALYSILTRRLSGEVSIGVMQFALGLVGTVILAPLAVIYWTSPPTVFDAVLMPMLGVFAWAGHQCLTRAHSFAGSSVLMPYSYAYLIFVAIAGFLVFAEIPDRLTVLGAVMIVSSGLTIWIRERQATQ